MELLLMALMGVVGFVLFHKWYLRNWLDFTTFED